MEVLTASQQKKKAKCSQEQLAGVKERKEEEEDEKKDKMVKIYITAGKSSLAALSFLPLVVR